MRLVRPHIPIRVRLLVIARQLQSAHKMYDVLNAMASVFPKDSARLEYLIEKMFGTKNVHLDHDPPLCLREIVDAEKGIYKPAANDPEFLIYRTEEDHRIKTFVRGDGAQLSDAAKRRKKLKAERPDRPRHKWPTGRKIPSRPFGRLP
jgi:hypothetical protein